MSYSATETAAGGWEFPADSVMGPGAAKVAVTAATATPDAPETGPGASFAGGDGAPEP
jgi:hypothetical protein